MMQIKNTLNRYGFIAIFFHWIIALFIIGQITLGLYMADLPIGSIKLKLYGWHKEIGVLILMLACLRFAWRLGNIIPVFPPEMPRWQSLIARAVHIAFYFFMFAIPLSGWLMSSAAGLSVSFFGLFLLPNLVSPNESLRMVMILTHKTLAFALIAMICLHILAALQHHFIYKDDILRRML